MSMYNRIIDLQKLGAAWDHVRRNQPAAGADHVSYEDFDKSRKTELMQLHLELAEHRYTPGPVKEVTIYRGEKARTISLFCMRDKIVQQSVADELSKIWEPRFSEHTYAYRSGRSALQIVELLNGKVKNYDWFLKCDITKYFDNIDQKLLLKDLREWIREEDVIGLIKIILESRVLDEHSGSLAYREKGVFQGSAMAPVLSNIYLMKFDRMMGADNACYIRYSDDILLLGTTRGEMEKAFSQIRLMLEERKLEIQDRKTMLGSVKDGFDFLGYHYSHDGKSIPAGAEASLQERLETMWLSGRGTVGEKLKKAAEIVGGWEQYYRQERKPGGILEYAVYLYMTRNKAENVRESAVRLRTDYQNSYKDLAIWLADVWNGWKLPQMELLEYEQYFQIESSDQEQFPDPGSRESGELLETYRRLMIQETKEELEDAVQLYADMGLYRRASQLRGHLEHLEAIPAAVSVSERQLISRAEEDDGREWLPSGSELQQYMSLFCGREDLYGMEQFVHGRRQTEAVFHALTEEVVRKHLHGELTVSTYVQRPNGTAHFMVFDIDVSRKCLLQYPVGTPQFEQYLKKAAVKAGEIRKKLAERGMKTYLEFSGCRGYHVWLFFSEWIPVRYVNLLQEALENAKSENADPSQDEISVECFPNRQRMKAKPGQCIKLPLGIHTKTAQNSYLLDEGFQPVPFDGTGRFLMDAAVYSLTALKRVLGSFTHAEAAADSGTAANVPQKRLDTDLSAFGVLAPPVGIVLKNCSLMLFLCQKALKTGYLSHCERLSVLYVFGHLGDEGKAFVHAVMGFTLNYQYTVTERFISRLPEKPVSCVKLRDQYKTVTAEYGCSCRFRRTKNCYPSPVLHAVCTVSDENPGITIPVSRTLSRDKAKEIYGEINIHKKVQELAEKIVEFKKQKRSIDRSVGKLEKELEQIFDSAGTDCMEIQMGMLIRRKIENGYEWVIEL